MARPQHNDTETSPNKAISVRDVDSQVWKDFKKLAVLHEMTLGEYLKFIVRQEMKRVSISKK